MQQNALLSGAKRSAICCETRGKMLQNAIFKAGKDIPSALLIE